MGLAHDGRDSLLDLLLNALRAIWVSGREQDPLDLVCFVSVLNLRTVGNSLDRLEVLFVEEEPVSFVNHNATQT